MTDELKFYSDDVPGILAPAYAGDCKELPLSRGEVCLVDADDYEYLSSRKWYTGKNGYAAGVRKSEDGGNGHTILMHRLIAKADSNQQVDHINGNRLDNRKSNLRIATLQQNNFNRPAQNPKSGFKGVYFDKPRGNYKPYISVNQKRTTLGVFASAKDAALVYDAAARLLHGEFARTNFPQINPNGFEEYAARAISGGTRTRVNTPTKWTGVFQDKRTGRWSANVAHGGAQHHFGSFNVPEEAARARDAYVLEHGLNRRLNFPKGE